MVVAFAYFLSQALHLQSPWSGNHPSGALTADTLGTSGSVTGTASLVQTTVTVNWFAWFVGLAAAVDGFVCGVFLLPRS